MGGVQGVTYLCQRVPFKRHYSDTRPLFFRHSTTPPLRRPPVRSGPLHLNDASAVNPRPDQVVCTPLRQQGDHGPRLEGPGSAGSTRSLS